LACARPECPDMSGPNTGEDPASDRSCPGSSGSVRFCPLGPRAWPGHWCVRPGRVRVRRRPPTACPVLELTPTGWKVRWQRGSRPTGPASTSLALRPRTRLAGSPICPPPGLSRVWLAELVLEAGRITPVARLMDPEGEHGASQLSGFVPLTDQPRYSRRCSGKSWIPRTIEDVHPA
jgi:hypothetical protein